MDVGGEISWIKLYFKWQQIYEEGRERGSWGNVACKIPKLILLQKGV
jgi:hypothetical protein